MAGRGGYQKPKSGAQNVSGPGRFSRRTDATKSAERARADKRPTLDREDLQYGDIQAIEDAKGRVPIPTSAGALRQRLPQGGPGMQGEAATEKSLPPWLYEMGSNRPGAPMTTGLDIGPGAGPEALQSNDTEDVRELVLAYLSRNYANEDASKMLQEIQLSRAQTRTPFPGAPAPTPLQPPAAQPKPVLDDEGAISLEQPEQMAEPMNASPAVAEETPVEEPTEAPIEESEGV